MSYENLSDGDIQRMIRALSAAYEQNLSIVINRMDLYHLREALGELADWRRGFPVKRMGGP